MVGFCKPLAATQVSNWLLQGPWAGVLVWVIFLIMTILFVGLQARGSNPNKARSNSALVCVAKALAGNLEAAGPMKVGSCWPQLPLKNHDLDGVFWVVPYGVDRKLVEGDDPRMLLSELTTFFASVMLVFTHQCQLSPCQFSG